MARRPRRERIVEAKVPTSQGRAGPTRLLRRSTSEPDLVTIRMVMGLVMVRMDMVLMLVMMILVLMVMMLVPMY